MAQRNGIKSGVNGRRALTTNVGGARRVVNGTIGSAPKNFDRGVVNSARSDVNDSIGTAEHNASNGRKSKRRKRLAIAAGALTIGAAAVVTVNDDAKHAYTAAQRSYRVLATLYLNIKEYDVSSEPIRSGS